MYYYLILLLVLPIAAFGQRTIAARKLILDDNQQRTITFQTAAPLSANYTLLFPSSQGGQGTSLVNDGNGNLSWDRAGDVFGSGAQNQVAFWSSSDSLTGENDLWWDNLLNRFGIGTNTPQASLHVVGSVRISSLGGSGTGIVQVNNNGDLYANSNPGFWNTIGNSGLVDGAHYIGTNDNVPFTIKVNNTQVWRGIWNTISPNIISGFSSNSIMTGVVGAVISGGGSTSGINTVNMITDNYGVVGGGASNRAGDNAGTTGDRQYATVSGGSENIASGTNSTVSGGLENLASASLAAVAGGGNNTASGAESFVGGGQLNVAGGLNSSVLGGIRDSAMGSYSVVGGGSSNNASGLYSGVFSGEGNQTSGIRSVVFGGNSNHASGANSCVSGGSSNTSSGQFSSVMGGNTNNASGRGASILGGEGNTASGVRSVVLGGQNGAATRYGQIAHSNGSFAAAGDAQTSIYLLTRQTSSAANTTLFLDGHVGASNSISIPVNSTMTFFMLISAMSDLTSEAASYEVRGMIKNVGGTTSIVGAVSIAVIAEDDATWNVAVTANDALDRLQVTVNGDAAENVRWVCTVYSSETSW
jgi:hypothetical protein